MVSLELLSSYYFLSEPANPRTREPANPRTRGPRTADRGLARERQPAHPDIAIAHRIAVILQRERQLGGVRGVFRFGAVTGGADQLPAVLGEHTVPQHGRERRPHKLVSLETR